MIKKFPLIALALSILLLVGFVLGNSYFNSSAAEDGSYKYYWGNTCPHCAIVADFMNSWQGNDGQNPITSGKIKVNKKEVYDNQRNANELLSQAARCDIPKDEVPVPFLVTPDGKCIIGDQPIIDHFKNLGF